MRWREAWVPAADVSRIRFNAVQVLLALFTLFAIATLVFSGIRNGLLAAPDMGIADLNYGGGEMWWFVDQTDGVIEAPTIISAPMWVYRALFFAWATWMAFALVRWLRWAFNAWKTNGLWRGDSGAGNGVIPQFAKWGRRLAVVGGAERSEADPFSRKGGCPLPYSTRPSR